MSTKVVADHSVNPYVMPYYFAYGSNMNPDRMAQRGLDVLEAMPARLDNMVLCFNKRSRRNARWACANIGWAPGQVVEGVLYRLADHEQILKMDPFEGAPRYYSRERFVVTTAEHQIPYVANPASISQDVLPLRWYLGQLLAGQAFLSEPYVKFLRETPCLDEDNEGWG